MIVDDNQDDVRLLHRELVLAGIRHPIHVLRTGEQLFSYLKGEGEYQDRAKYLQPVMLMLELRISPKEDFEVLRWLKANPMFSGFPVLVVSVVSERLNIAEAYRRGAKTFLSKPITRPALREALRALNLLPPGEPD